MSIDQRKVIDFVAADEKANEVILFITDHLDWSDPKNEHLLILQDKINDYLAAIESGELVEKYPLGKGKQPIIQVIAKYPLSEIAEKFYEKAKELVKSAGFELRFKLSP